MIQSYFWPIVWSVAAVVFIAFTFVIMFGAPFLPTLKEQVPRAMKMLNLGPGQTLLELGSGDGRVLAAAAEQGIKAVGYEINPFLVLYSRFKTRKYGKNVVVVWGNFWTKKLPPADAIFVFLLQPYMEKLDQKITKECAKPVRLVSFGFTINSKKPKKQDKGIYLYEYN